ncbi:hypothetical protein FA13DRAFT_1337385 [Coprinellus micaceus]|uniref:Uncharacterized protein n=1 Tax=Coprinellus micaceus TaxID=71717 RepID=A0A4Y7TN40_COPMI|nr:hypothetical protein FA13DRAFT_1337385 [Coprinellus micaceus]
MAKGSKQKMKLKQQPDEPKAGGVSSQAARRGGKLPPPQRGREESQETLAHGGDDGDDPAYLAPGGWSRGGGGWGEPGNTDSWDFTQSQLINQPPPLSRTPAPNPPPNNATLGNLAPPSRHSPSSRRSPSIDGDENFAQARDSFGYDQEHNIGHHGHGWDPTPAANNPPSTGATNIPAPSALASPAVRRISEMPQDAPVGVSSIAAAEAAQAEMRAKGVKMSSASAAAKKVEAGNPNMAGNRDSLWSKAHDIANNKLPEHTPFIPSNRPLSQARPPPGKDDRARGARLGERYARWYTRPTPVGDEDTPRLDGMGRGEAYETPTTAPTFPTSPSADTASASAAA